MPETLVRFDEPISDSRGERYFAQAIGRQRDEDGLWEGGLEFVPVGEAGERILSGRETTQPSRETLLYWAEGLTRVYLMGALERALRPTPALRREREAFDSAPTAPE
jgi:hypothetical protein